METQLVVFDATAECRKSFMKCQELSALMKGKWAENRLADFNLWASGLGASARNRASLDSRLALRPDTRDTIANLLRLLNTVVVKCIALAQPGKTEDQAVIEKQEQRGRISTASPQAASARSFSPWPDDSSSDSLSDDASDLAPDTSFSKAMKDVDVILNQLARIAVVIRRSGTRSRLQKADRMFNPKDYQELNTHLTSVILSRAPSALSFVQSQLINGNLKRRHRFVYAQMHSTGLGLAPPPVPAPKTTVSESASESIQLEVRVQNEPEIAEKSTDSTSQTAANIPAENSHNPSVKTGTSASGVTDLRELSQNSVPSQGASTQMSTTVIKLDYPYPPKMNDDALVFRCPCCCQVLPAMMADKNRWKKHIAEDVCPYNCVIPGCPQLNILYTKKDDWKKHLLKDHDNIESWICFACNENVQFNEEAAFVAHLSQEHRDAITSDDIPTLKTACKRSTPAKIICCPLCYWPAPEDGEVDKAALIDHIAEELHVFSLRSLPWGPDDEDYDKVRLDSATAKVRGWLELEIDDVPEASTIPEAEKQLPNHYFHRNEYFAESMKSSDGSGVGSDDTMKRELELLREEGPPLDSEHDTMMQPPGASRRSPPPPKSTRRSLTFRVSGIPLEVTRDKLGDILSRLPNTTETIDGQSNLLRFSYSPAAVSMLPKRFAVATVTFAEAPNLGELEKAIQREIGIDASRLMVDLDFLGLTPLADPLQNTAVDIIAVTGPAGHAFGSWKSKNKPDMWLRDFLPISVSNARVLTYGYDTELPGSRSKSSIPEFSRKLLESIKATRDESTKHRPLILIGHSLGGVVVKQALVQASEGSEDDLAVFRSCYAVILFAVPNRGLDNISLMSMVKGQPNENLVRNLSVESPFLNHLHESFNKRFAPDSEIISAYETRPTPTVEWNSATESWERTGPKVIIVEKNSAINASPNKMFCYRVPMDADHSEIVKFSDASNSGYIVIQSRIERWVQNAPAVIRERFRRLRTKSSIMEAQFIDALKAPDYTAFRSHKIDNPASGTLGWFLGLQQLSSWLTTHESSVLWVNGSPGQGKTIIAKFLLAYLEDLHHNSNNHITVIYFFFYHQDDDYRTMSAAIRSLIKQLLSAQGAFDIISDRFNIEASTINDQMAWDILEELLRSPVFGTIYCVIDALDECYDDESRQRLLAVIKKFTQTPLAENKDKYPVLKAFLTSRPTPDLGLSLGQFPSIHLKASYDDLKIFIQSKIHELDLEKQHEGEVVNVFSSRVEQTFLWISIVLKKLKLKLASNMLSLADMEQIINESPSHLTDLYESLLFQVLQSEDVAGQKLLIWTVFGRRALSLNELEVALATQEGSKSQESIEKYRIRLTERTITSDVGVFLEIFNEKVYLIHQSAKDFLLNNKWLAEAEFGRGLRPNLYLAKICMTYLCFTDFTETGPCGDSTLLEKRYSQYPLFHYAARNWHRHISTDDDLNIFDGIIGQLTEIGSPGLLAWGEAAGVVGLDKAEDKYDIATKANIPWLPDFQWKDHIITEEMIQKAARDGIAGYEFLKKFTRKPNVRITEEAFCAAALYFDHEMISLLLEQRGQDFQIPEEVVKGVAGNFNNGKEVMALLLDQREDQIIITEDIIKAAAGNPGDSKEVMTLLLDRRGDQIILTEDIIKAAAGNPVDGEEVMALLLDRREDQIIITEDIIKAAAGNLAEGKEVMALLLDRRGDQIIITEDIIKAAAGNPVDGERVMALLLDQRGDQIIITEDIIKAAAGNPGDGERVMRLLLNRRGDQVIITEDIIKAAAGNSGDGKEIMRLLLNRRGDQIIITEDIMKAAAGNRNENEVMTLLRRNGGTTK